MSQQDTVKELLNKYGNTYSKEIGIDLEKESPSALFQWLFSANLFSARISSSIAVDAAKALIDDGLTTPEKMKNTSWEHRVRILNKASYTRYQERTATFLADLSEHLIENYGGDLRKLKEEAGDDTQKLRELLKDFKGMGDTGVDIFFRETQAVWKELYPFADKKALQAAGKMDLPKDTDQLAKLVSRNDFPRLIAALIRTDLENNYQLEDQEKEGNEAPEALTKEELYQQARKKNIPGRSHMNKQELKKALRES
jgi:hypothetical protein